jgi:hypothetical protein
LNEAQAKVAAKLEAASLEIKELADEKYTAT